MTYARKIKMTLAAGMILVTSQSQAQDVATIVNQIKGTVEARLHDLWRENDVKEDPGNRLKRGHRWKPSAEAKPTAKSLSPGALQEFLQVRDAVMALDDKNQRAGEAFVVRQIEMISEDEATEVRPDGRRVVRTLKTPDGVAFQAGVIDPSSPKPLYYKVGALLTDSDLDSPNIRSGYKVIPVIDIAALRGEELTPAWKGANSAAAEIATSEVVQLILSDEPVTEAALERVRLKINERYVKAEATWSPISKAPGVHLQIEDIVKQLNDGKAISGTDTGLLAKYLGDQGKNLPAENVTANDIANMDGGAELLRNIKELGLTAQKDRRHIDTVIDTIVSKYRKGLFKGFGEVQFLRLGHLTRAVMNATPDFTKLVEVIKRAR